MSVPAGEPNGAEPAAVDCVCHVPSPPAEFVDSAEALDATLCAERDRRLQRRAAGAAATGDDAFPYNSVFAPRNLFPYRGVGARKRCMEDDSVVAGIRAQLQREREEAEEMATALEEAELAALELKCTLLEMPKSS